MLARAGDGGLVPWAGGRGAEAWMLSEVRASATRLRGHEVPDQTVPEIAALTRDWPDWQRAEVTICPVGPDGTIRDGLRYNADEGVLFG